ncbi:MAG TPA: hypothetical protein VG034_09410 [Acidimicrobiia bacterium]|nr:hypothetical protein [Acidimicrobiia bacterium]
MRTKLTGAVATAGSAAAPARLARQSPGRSRVSPNSSGAKWCTAAVTPGRSSVTT